MKRVEILGGLLKRIGNYRPSFFKIVFEDRLILQKTVYLLQAFDLNLGYIFNFYVRGPYSPQLARDGFELVNKYEKVPLVRFAEHEAERRFVQFLKFIGNRSNDHKWLEQLASIHFLANVYPKKPRESIIKAVAEKTFSTPQKCEEAWDYLEKHGLLK